MGQRAAPYVVRLNPETAKELAVKGSTLLVLGVPEMSLFGIDHQKFVVGPKFKGVKMVPPGVHCISYNAVGSGGDVGATTSFWVCLKPQEILVKQWDPATELLVDLPDEDEAERYRQGVRRFDFDDSLAPYDLANYNRWCQLSGHITSQTLDRLTPLGSGNICALAEADPSLLRPITSAEAALYCQLAEGRQRGTEKQGMPAEMQIDESPEVRQGDGTRDESTASGSGQKDLQPNHADRCFYTKLPRLVKKQGLTPQELTLLNMDKSLLLNDLVAVEYKGQEEEVLAEFQFAFLAFLVGQSLEGYAQWKSLLQLLLSCVEAPLQTRTAMFTELMACLYHQIRFIIGQGTKQSQGEGSFLNEELTQDTFLYTLVSRFLQVVMEAGLEVPSTLSSEVIKLTKLLEETLGWSFMVEEIGGEEDDEYAPVVVDL